MLMPPFKHLLFMTIGYLLWEQSSSGGGRKNIASKVLPRTVSTAENQYLTHCWIREIKLTINGFSEI